MSRFLLIVVCLLGPEIASVEAQQSPLSLKHYTFPIDPRTPIEELLPSAPDVPEPLSPWLVRGWTKAPEVLFQKPPALQTDDPTNLKALEGVQENTALTIARINHLNQKGADHFLKTLLERRADLAGMPFVMGNACRQSKERGLRFVHESALVRAALRRAGVAKTAASAGPLWTHYEKDQGSLPKENEVALDDQIHARVAALMQILGPGDQVTRRELVAHLAGIDHKEATRALARLAVFSFEEDVRKLAREALRKRSPEGSTDDILLAGLRYPWPAVAANAGEAIVRLDRQALVPLLVAVLDEPDPRAPVEREINGQKVLAVRELVRLNHHRNCLLCHAPGNTPDVELDDLGRSTKIATGPVPGQGVPFSSSGQVYYAPPKTPDVLVRADVTYLRQDFSLLQHVKDAAPWPEMQRFDFLVRTRPVTSTEATAYQRWVKERGLGYLAPHQRAALAALRALTGRDAPEPTAKVWWAVLEK